MHAPPGCCYTLRFMQRTCCLTTSPMSNPTVPRRAKILFAPAKVVPEVPRRQPRDLIGPEAPVVPLSYHPLNRFRSIGSSDFLARSPVFHCATPIIASWQTCFVLRTCSR
jgi:hypothetical protein